MDFDFHTEPAGKPSSASDSFEKGEAVQKKGGYTAPYDGIHGWYWENKGSAPVTVTLTIGRVLRPRDAVSAQATAPGHRNPGNREPPSRRFARHCTRPATSAASRR